MSFDLEFRRFDSRKLAVESLRRTGHLSVRGVVLRVVVCGVVLVVCLCV